MTGDMQAYSILMVPFLANYLHLLAGIRCRYLQVPTHACSSFWCYALNSRHFLPGGVRAGLQPSALPLAHHSGLLLSNRNGCEMSECRQASTPPGSVWQWQLVIAGGNQSCCRCSMCGHMLFVKWQGHLKGHH